MQKSIGHGFLLLRLSRVGNAFSNRNSHKALGINGNSVRKLITKRIYSAFSEIGIDFGFDFCEFATACWTKRVCLGIQLFAILTVLQNFFS